MAALPASLADSDSLTGFPEYLASQPLASPGLSAPLPSVMGDPDLRAFLQALPTWSDMEVLVLCLEEAHHRDIHSVKADVQLLSERISTGETSLSSLESRVFQLEQAQSRQAAQVTSLQLHMKELKDRSHQNNLRLRGIPEATGQEILQTMVLEIC